MNKHNLHLVLQIMLFFGVIFGGPFLACSLGMAAPHGRIVWIAGTGTLLLKGIGVGWLWSILAGAVVAALYFFGIEFTKAWTFA